MPKPDADSAGVRFPPPLMFLGALVIGVLMQFIWSLPFLPWRIGMFGGAIAFGLGVVLVASAALLFTRVGTGLPPWTPATQVVIRGPYRFTRNPMYVGMALIQAGIGLCLGSLWILLMLIPVLWWIRQHVITPEEAYMEAKFGQTYRDYCAQVRRWL